MDQPTTVDQPVEMPKIFLSPVILLIGFIGFIPRVAFCEQPNIVLIMADDMGFGDVQTLNPKSKIPTPNLDRLAAQGMTFSDAHTPSSVCTPTRYALLTGRYCWRTSLKRGVLNGYSKPLIQPGRETIAGFLRDRGYSTGIVGKWHLGLDFSKSGDQIDFSKPVNNGPNQRGFDYSFIIPASLDFPPYIYIENGAITEPQVVDQESQKFPAFLRQGPRSKALVMENCLDDLAAKASGFIDSHSKSEAPFFLYCPLTAPHKPVLAHPRFRGKTELGDYGDFVHQVDVTVGAVLSSINENGIANETLVIYTSDNGSFMNRLNDANGPDHTDDPSIQAYHPNHHTANGPFRGTKADIWEAGHHVPFFARWPGKIEPGSKCTQEICLTDVFATVADIVGARLKHQSAPDSFSLYPLMQGKDWEVPRAPVIHHSAAGMFAIRQGDWKLVLGNGSGGRQKPRGKAFSRPYHLSNIAKDLGETKNWYQTHPEIAEKLEKQCLAIIQQGRSRK
ncbi:MAG: arylsulfatase [Planctomycetota bacterium]|nr:arylsulfatase [Planctomycetota bacterium]